MTWLDLITGRARPRNTHPHLNGGPLDGERDRFVAPIVAVDGGVYRLRGQTHVWCEGGWQCDGCGGYVTPNFFEVVSTCPLCGAPKT